MVPGRHFSPVFAAMTQHESQLKRTHTGRGGQWLRASMSQISDGDAAQVLEAALSCSYMQQLLLLYAIRGRRSEGRRREDDSICSMALPGRHNV